MLETPHVVVGAAIATAVGDPVLAFPLALGSHFVLDKIPHWNPHTYTETIKNGIPDKNTIILTIVDISTALCVGLYFAFLALPNFALAETIILACFASVLPDVIKYPFFLFKNTRKGLYKKYVDWERAFQVDTENKLYGLFTQFVIILASLYWIFG